MVRWFDAAFDGTGRTAEQASRVEWLCLNNASVTVADGDRGQMLRAFIYKPPSPPGSNKKSLFCRLFDIIRVNLCFYVDSIAVSVSVVILVEFDKYYQKQIQIPTDGETSRPVYFYVGFQSGLFFLFFSEMSHKPLGLYQLFWARQL